MFEKIFMNTCLRLLLPALLLSASAPVAMAQTVPEEYRVFDDLVLYRGAPLAFADPGTFVILGQGYAKDYDHVYLDGQILRYVDPATFRLKLPRCGSGEHGPGRYGLRNRGYFKTSHDVLFNGKKIEGASVSSFEVLEGGYARDAFSVYFLGRKIDASRSSFRYLGDGYAEDAFDTYYLGRKVDE